MHLSRELLVIVLGNHADAKRLQHALAEALTRANIPYFLPSATQPNTVSLAQKDPNAFWCDGALTLSTIHRAKGNEADVVYIVGFDAIAKNEHLIGYRNQLFVALTRTRGWAIVSGVDTIENAIVENIAVENVTGDEAENAAKTTMVVQHAMTHEMRQVIAAQGVYTFVFRRPQRNVGEDETSGDET